MSNRKREKKLQTEKRGVKQQKQNQKKIKLQDAQQSWIAMFCVWVVAVVHAVLVAAVHAVGRRCWLLCAAGHAWVWGVVAGYRGCSWVPGSQFVLKLGGVAAAF